MKAIHILGGLCLAASLVSIVEGRDTSPEIMRGTTGDDTATLQAALSKCTQPHAPCELRLGAGVFHTDVLLVKGFHGSITGRGQGRTIIRPITSRPLRSTPAPFLGEPTLAHPYPILLHFADAKKVSISKLTLEFPPEMSVMPYDYYGYADQPPLAEGITDSLLAAIQVDGKRNAELRMAHVTIEATDNDSYSFSNVFAAVHFEGQLRFIGGADQTRRLQGGRFTAHDNRIERTGRGFWVESADHIAASIAGNEIDVRLFGVYTQDLGASKVVTVHNEIHAELDGVLVAQDARPAELPSDYLVALNKLNVNLTGKAPLGGANDGVAVFDYKLLAESIQDNVTIFANDIVLGENVFQGITVFSDGPGEIRVIGNRVRGAPTDTGIWVELSRGTFVAANDLGAIEPRFEDVYLLPSSRDCRVIEPRDSVLDEGTNNQVLSGP